MAFTIFVLRLFPCFTIQTGTHSTVSTLHEENEFNQKFSVNYLYYKPDTTVIPWMGFNLQHY